MNKCEEFVEEVRTRVSKSIARGDSPSQTVMQLAEYYAGIPATWGPIPAIPGLYIPGIIPQVAPFPGKGDRYLLEDNAVHGPSDDPVAQAARQQYGFKRIFFSNTHHYFGDFYVAWFWGGPFATRFNVRHEQQATFDPNPQRRQQYDEGIADLALAEVAIRHAEYLKSLRFTPEYGQTSPAGHGLAAISFRKNPMGLLPQLLAQDACAKSYEEIYANWPRPDLERILGPRP